MTQMLTKWFNSLLSEPNEGFTALIPLENTVASDLKWLAEFKHEFKLWIISVYDTEKSTSVPSFLIISQSCIMQNVFYYKSDSENCIKSQLLQLMSDVNRDRLRIESVLLLVQNASFEENKWKQSHYALNIILNSIIRLCQK